MLYVFYGTDEKKSRERLNTTLSALRKKAPEAHAMRITDEDVAGVDMNMLLGARGLFYPKQIVIFDKAFALKGACGHVTARFKDMAASEHVFLVLEGAVDSELEKSFAKHAHKRELHGSSKKEKKEREGDWAITGALERHDAGAMWVALERSLLSGTAPEAIHGQLFWKAKQMLLSAHDDERRVFTKKIIGDLAELPHEARRRGVELEYALEEFSLGI